MVKKIIIFAAIVIIIIVGLTFGRDKAIDYYKKQTTNAVKKGNYQLAVDNYSKVVNILFSRSSSDYSTIAMLYYNNGNTEKAIENLNKAIKIDNKNSEAHKGLGIIKQDDGDLKGSIKELTLALKSNPKDIESLLARSRAYRLLGEKDKAISDLKQVQKIDPKNPAAANALQYLE
ncbi:MAG: tetratricopeptide repeat protein [Firmicutes bacterium]|nr:tetratricopeptide repeat protein [Bacillota bacterium]